MLLALTTYEPTQQEISLLVVIAGVTSLLVLANLITSIWDRFRPKPSPGKELSDWKIESHRVFATKDELVQSESRLTLLITNSSATQSNNSGRVEKELESIRSKVDQGFSELQRNLGRLEGRVDER